MKLRRARRFAAFALAELMVSTAVFGIAGVSAILALSQMNHRAFVARCQTGASTVAQNQIDQILSIAPFNPRRNQVPPVLTLGTTESGSESDPSVPIYTDPQSGEVLITGWMTTTIEALNPVHPTTGASLPIYRATVQVFYRFRGRIYRPVTMTTIRASDT